MNYLLITKKNYNLIWFFLGSLKYFRKNSMKFKNENYETIKKY